jgi:hypothetical protein
VIGPYYLKQCVADYLRKDSKIINSRDLCHFFKYLVSQPLTSFTNTEGCNEPVYGTSRADRKAALATKGNAAKMTRKAVSCEKNGNIADAWWRNIFDWHFATF